MSNLTHDSPSVHSYLGILQDVIGRMAGNSAGAKTWCIALVSAILVVIAGRGAPGLVGIAFAPVILFAFLDAYYLALERRFRGIYNDFIRSLHEGKATIEDLFVVSPSDAAHVGFSQLLEALASVSVWPFYSVQIALLIAVKFWLASSPSPPVY